MNLITNVILPGRGTTEASDVDVSKDSNKITSIKPHHPQSESSCPNRVIPTLCHPHIHLDKPYLLTCHNPGKDLSDYSDLAPVDGTFAEALAKTSEAKKRYTYADLVLRGSQLITESIQAGVTSMRAFIEVDHVTEHKCIQAGITLKQHFEQYCHVQLCAFAQDPIFNADKHGEENREVMEEILQKHHDHIEVLGSTPYVEGTKELQEKNIEWAVKTAMKHDLHLDFHLDYNLDPTSPAMIWHVVETLERMQWTIKAKDKKIVVGHCTRMTLFDETEMQNLASAITEAKLPISFVGLPTSDLFMMGRPPDGSWSGQRPRGTMPVLDLIRKFKLDACIGINNVGNPFTPWGSIDPLRLASLCVGVYQAGTPRDAELLFECVSARAQTAIGLERLVVKSLEQGADALFMVVENKKIIEVEGMQTVLDSMLDSMGVPQEFSQRQRLSVADIVWDPPELRQRHVVGSPLKIK